MNDLDQYLDVLFEGLEGYVYSPVKGEKFEQYWFEYPKQRQELVDHIASARGEVYLSPAVYYEKKADKTAIKKVQCTWIDFDQSEKIDFKALAPNTLPTMLVQTSFDSHVHAYWRIPPTNQTEVEELNRRLTYYLGADNGGWDMTQLLRPPGTFNHKRGLPVVLAHKSQDYYTVSQFEFVPTVSAPVASVTSVDELLPVGDLLSQLPIKIGKMVTKESPVEPHRSSFLAKLASELAEEGFNHLQIVSCLKEADERIGKYSGRRDQMLRLSQIADYAIHKFNTEATLEVWSPESILAHVQDLEWILPNWLHSKGQMVVSSAPGTGKTQWCFQLAYCLALGERFMGILSPKKHKVFFFSLEMDVSSLKYIMSKHKDEWNRIPTLNEIQIIDDTSSLTHYENLIAQYESSVLIIDSLSELLDDDGGDPAGNAKRIMKWVKKIRRRYNVAVVLIHHNRKATEGNKKPNKLSDIEGSYHFARTTETAITFWEDSKGIELSVVKARFGPKESYYLDRNKNLWFSRRDSVTNRDRTESVSDDRERTEGHKGTGSGHGDKLHGFSPGSFSFGFSPDNKRE